MVAKTVHRTKTKRINKLTSTHQTKVTYQHRGTWHDVNQKEPQTTKMYKKPQTTKMYEQRNNT